MFEPNQYRELCSELHVSEEKLEEVIQMTEQEKKRKFHRPMRLGLVAAAVAAMGDVIQPIPPTPLFDDLTAEDAGMLQTPLSDAWEVWNDAFLTGKKSIDTDWDAYVTEMKDKGIEEFCKLYNDHLAK